MMTKTEQDFPRGLNDRMRIFESEVEYLRGRSGTQVSIDADELADLYEELFREMQDTWTAVTGEVVWKWRP